MYWGTSETLLPVYQSVGQAMKKHPEVDTVVNFASSRSVYSSTMELMEFSQIKSIAIIAEGVPERVSFQTDRPKKSNQIACA
jgi:ATP citrate (pro-S)-lyase